MRSRPTCSQEGDRRIGRWDFTDKEPRLKSWSGTIKGLARTAHNSNTILRLLRRIMSLCIYFCGHSSWLGDSAALLLIVLRSTYTTKTKISKSNNSS